MMRVRLVFVCAGLAAVASPLPAHADPPPGDDVCAASEASAQLAPAPDSLAAAAACREASGDLTGAEQLFARAVDLSRRSGGDAAPYIAQAARIRAANAVVILDLERVSVSAWVALSIGDIPLHRPRAAVRMQAIVAPGIHAVRADRPGCESWETRIAVDAGDVTTVAVPELACIAPNVAVSEYEIVDLESAPAARWTQPLTRNERIGAYFFGASAGTAVVTLYAWSESTKRINRAKTKDCRRDDCGDEEGRALRESAHRYERLAWISGGVAASALLTGFYLRTFGSNADMNRSVAAVPTEGGGVLAIGGTF